MNKKLIAISVVFFSLLLPSCNGEIASVSYDYYDPNDIVNVATYNVSLIENEYIDISIDKEEVKEGEYVNITLNNVYPGFCFVGWYINGVYRGEEQTLSIQVFEDIEVEAKYEKTESVNKIIFYVGGQVIRQVYTDYNATLSQEVFDSVESLVTYLPYGYSICDWKDINGIYYKAGDVFPYSLSLYPEYEIDKDIQKIEYSLIVDGGQVINADTFEVLNDKNSTMGSMLTFTALDENGQEDTSKAWVNEDGEVYSYKSTFTMTLVENLNLHTVDISSLDTSEPILQSSELLIIRCLADTPFEYYNLRLYVRVIIPLSFEYYGEIDDYGAKMERVSNTGHRQRATFALNKSQWSVNGEAWCAADNQALEFTYKGSSYIEFKDDSINRGEEEDAGYYFNTAGWKESKIVTVD